MDNNAKKIFVSYTKKDEDWATWIAEKLENDGHKVTIMAWDFGPGDNFVKNMDEALQTSSIVVAVLSSAYMNSYHCQSELTAAYVDEHINLILIRVDDFRVRGLWAPIVYIDLVNKSEETANKLLKRIFEKPVRKSQGYPGGVPDDWMPSNNLPNRNSKFTGRKQLLKDIHNAFQTKNEISLVQARAITGMGGIGKSETAKEYAYHYRNEYNLIWWINAETSASMEEAYRSFAQENNLGSPEDQPEMVIAHVKRWMNSNNHWLFIFDNAEDEKSMEKYCSSSGAEGQHILVTSRNRRFKNYLSMNISVFSESEACNFIEKHTEKPADEHFKKLAEQMGYLPLAIDQAGAYMSVNKMSSYEEYFDLYEKYHLELLADEDDPEKKTVATTWQISFDKISNQASRQLLHLFAFFAPDNIRREWFVTASDVLPETLQEVAAHDLKYKKAIAELTQYSLVTLNDDGALSIHRLVQEVIRDSLKHEQAEWCNHCVNILNELYFTDFSTAESRTIFLTLVPHILAATNETGDEDATVARLYFFLGYGYDELADYDPALKYYKKALDIREKVLGKEHPDTATTYNNMGDVYRAKGDYDRALEYHVKALDIKEKVLGKEHPSTATTYNNMALVFRAQGDNARALEYYGKALAIREKVLGKEHPDTATTYHNMALVFRAQGDYTRALEYYGKALTIREKILGKEHPDTAGTYNNMAAVYDNQGDYARALEYYGKALTIVEKVLGKEHPNTASTYNNMAVVFRAQGDYTRALEYYGKDLAICEKVLGKEHPSTATTYNNMALVYYNQGDYTRALEYFLKSLKIFIKALGIEHPNTKTVYNNMAYAYKESGNPKPFEEWLEEKIRELFGE